MRDAGVTGEGAARVAGGQRESVASRGRAPPVHDGVRQSRDDSPRHTRRSVHQSRARSHPEPRVRGASKTVQFGAMVRRARRARASKHDGLALHLFSDGSDFEDTREGGGGMTRTKERGTREGLCHLYFTGETHSTQHVTTAVDERVVHLPYAAQAQDTRVQKVFLHSTIGGRVAETAGLGPHRL